MDILYGLMALCLVSTIANLWAIHALKSKLSMPDPANKPIPSLANLTPVQIADRLVARMARTQLDPEASRYALDKVKNRFPDIIKTDEQAKALIVEALKRAKKLKAV